MLLELHVKNLALIEQADVEFGDGLNILTGETGAGKSVIIGSVSLALGQKAPKDIIRSGADYAYVELIFSVEEERRRELGELEVFPDGDGLLIVTRKIMPTRSISKINDETVTVARLRQVTGLLMDIHGQHEHQSLLHISKHLEILDIFAKSRTELKKAEIGEAYRQYKALQAALEESEGDEESRRREADFLRFEIREIEDAGLKEGEEEELTEAYRRFTGSQRILENLSAAYQMVESDRVGQAIHQVNEVSAYDGQIKGILDQLYDAEAILSDVHHEIGAYLDNLVFDEEAMEQARQRLDQIHGLQAKYGNTLERIGEALEEKKSRLAKLENFDEYQKKNKAEYEQLTAKLEKLCGQLSKERQAAARELAGQVKKNLVELNFLDVEFAMEFRRLKHFTAQGYDEAEFVISTNPGEPKRSLGTVASGGELSRIMLAIKTVLAESDEIPTLIFDEIDTGISGRTAQKVSEQLAVISGSHQVICITHLPQIAAMADCHFEIAKSAGKGRTTTRIHKLDDKEMVEELARLLGGAQITDAVRQNAREMKALAGEKRGGWNKNKKMTV